MQVNSVKSKIAGQAHRLFSGNKFVERIASDKLEQLRLLVVHSHFRPGGVRRVIEMATPHLAQELRPRVSEVVLLGGEAPDPSWFREFEARLQPLPVHCQVDRSFGYWAEQRRKPGPIVRQIRHALEAAFQNTPMSAHLVWAHNPGLGRNLLLTRELQHACVARGARLVFHHHDWWFDNRWARWPEMRACGFRSVNDVARVIFSSAAGVRHAVINKADADVLSKHLSGRAGWLPNPVETRTLPSPAAARRALAWLHGLMGAKAPVWLLPCRLLRRKNIAEALLLTRWLRPEAWLVTTGGITSAEERNYATRLAHAAARHQWPLRLGVLDGAETGGPTVAELLAASEAVMLTSLQEGFGLPYLEAAAARRPLLARALPNMMPDLKQFGFEFPQSYGELWINSNLFDWEAEMTRQEGLFAAWRRQLPSSCRCSIGTPWLLGLTGRPEAAPFSRLTLTSQLEVLQAPIERSWNLCAPLNPFLGQWRELARKQDLKVSPWPAQARNWLEGEAYARRFQHLLDTEPNQGSTPDAAKAAQADFLGQKLATGNLYPLMWSSRT
jgi:glycosyltransferase involved in cell wall biosynthesis